MTICIDIRNLAQKNRSGVGIYTMRLIDNLLEIDKVNQYKFFYNSKKYPLIKKYYPNVAYYDFKKSNKLMNITMLLFNYPKIDKLVNGFDVFFAPNINFFAFSRNKKIKKIITIHDISFHFFKKFYSIKSILWHRFINIKKIIKKFDHIITVSENTKMDLIREFGVNGEKITSIHLGVDNIRNIDSKNIRDEIKQIISSKYLLNINTIEPRKNIEGILNTFTELKEEGKIKDVKLVIAGGHGWNSSYIFKMIDENKYNEDIKVLNYITEDEKELLYKNAKIVLFPSFYEGFGLPIVEAQKYGVPVITSSNSSMTEINGCNGILVNPYNINDIKFAINNLISDIDLYKKYSKISIENTNKFTWDTCAKKTLEIFNNADKI